MGSPSGSTQSASTEYPAEARSLRLTWLSRILWGAEFSFSARMLTFTVATFDTSTPSKA